MPGFGDYHNTTISAAAVFDGSLYLGTTTDDGTELWSSGDGTTWHQVNSDGFGDGGNIAVGGDEEIHRRPQQTAVDRAIRRLDADLLEILVSGGGGHRRGGTVIVGPDGHLVVTDALEAFAEDLRAAGIELERR